MELSENVRFNQDSVLNKYRRVGCLICWARFDAITKLSFKEKSEGKQEWTESNKSKCINMGKGTKHLYAGKTTLTGTLADIDNVREANSQIKMHAI